MRKYRFFSPQMLAVGQIAVLDEALAHYITRVLRLQLGEEIYLFNNSGTEFYGTITQTSKTMVSVTIADSELAQTESPLELQLALALIKFDKIDLILQKACELGVSKIMLFPTQHTSIKNAYQRALEKHTHWQKILESAAAQCWRSSVPELTILPQIDDFFSQTANIDLKVILDPRASRQAILTPQKRPDEVVVLIGPEGGFSDAEISLAKISNFIGLPLGPRILRTETACFCALTLLQAEYGDLRC